MSEVAGSHAHDAATVADEVAALLDRLGDDGRAEEEAAEHFGAWWSARDPAAHELLRRLALSSTDPVALGLLLRLVDQHRLARPAVRRLLIDAHDVADAEQAALAVVATKVGQYDGSARFTTWLHQVAANEARMLIRSRERRPALAPAELPEPSETAYLTRLSSLVADRDVIQRALDDLEPTHRDVLLLREQDGFTYEEIAQQLGLPVGTVRSRLNRARGALAASLPR